MKSRTLPGALGDYMRPQLLALLTLFQACHLWLRTQLRDAGSKHLGENDPVRGVHGFGRQFGSMGPGKTPVVVLAIVIPQHRQVSHLPE